MTFEVKIHTTKKYYEECYSQLILFTKFRRWQPFLGLFWLTTGIVLYMVIPNDNLWLMKLLKELFFLLKMD